MKNDKTAKLAIEFYKKLGRKGVMALTNIEKDKATLRFILPFLKKSDKILDLACGYGRVTFMLAKIGFYIEGIDISSNLIKEARQEAKKLRYNIDFKIGDMRKLPYKDESFDKVLCLWSSFNHLLTENDHLMAINEIYRILRFNGASVIDVPNGESKWAKKKIKEYGRIVPDKIFDNLVINYIYDRETLTRLIKKSKFKRYTVKFSNIGGRKRIIVLLKK